MTYSLFFPSLSILSTPLFSAVSSLSPAIAPFLPSPLPPFIPITFSSDGNALQPHMEANRYQAPHEELHDHLRSSDSPSRGRQHYFSLRRLFNKTFTEQQLFIKEVFHQPTYAYLIGDNKLPNVSRDSILLAP